MKLKPEKLLWVFVFLLFIFLAPWFVPDPFVCSYSYLNTKTLKSRSFVRIWFVTIPRNDSTSLPDQFREQNLLRPGETVQEERLPEYWICTYMHSYTILGSEGFYSMRGDHYPTKLRFFVMEHFQEMFGPDYTETEEEFSARFTDYILSLNEEYKESLLPPDSDLRRASFLRW